MKKQTDEAEKDAREGKALLSQILRQLQHLILLTKPAPTALSQKFPDESRCEHCGEQFQTHLRHPHDPSTTVLCDGTYVSLLTTIRRPQRYRIYPTEAQQAILRGWEGTLRYLWNLCHNQWYIGLSRPKDERVFPTALSQRKEMTELLEFLPWMSDVQCQIRQKIIDDINDAWQRCLKKVARKPHWKSKGDSMRIYIPTATVSYTFDETKKTLAFDGPRFKTLGPLKVVVDRPHRGTVKSWSIIREVTEWYAIAACDLLVDKPEPSTKPSVGIDCGITITFADSTGRMAYQPIPKRLETQIKRAQRQLSKKKKGSNNSHKARIKLAKKTQKAARMREVFQHTQALYYAENYGTVVMEDLNIKNMSKSAKGTEEEPGKNVRAKAGLNRGILNGAWGSFRLKLDYKLDERGGKLVLVPPQYTSQTCPKCGHVDPDNRATQADFRCVKCGYEQNADTNAAVNIEAKGLRQLETTGALKLEKVQKKAQKNGGIVVDAKPRPKIKMTRLRRKAKPVSTSVKPTKKLSAEAA